MCYKGNAPFPMTFSFRAQRATLVAAFCVLAAIYGFAWFLPAIGLDYDDANFLIDARSIAGGHGLAAGNLPPLFPALLGLFTLVSQQTQWLKLLPLVCAIGWLLLTRRLLLKMGASRNGAWLLIMLAAACPAVIFLSTNLLPETLFGLLVTAALLALLEERAVLAGVLAGLATITRTGGIALLFACILTLIARRRFRAAAFFAAAAMLICAPWFGWSLARFSNGVNRIPAEVFTGLAASEKLVVLFQNFVALLESPFSLLSGTTSVYFIAATVVVLIRCFYVRRQLIPDMFVVLYCLSLLVWITPPTRYMAPILPLAFWIVWRVFRMMRNQEALAALVLIAVATPLAADGIRLPAARRDGTFPIEITAADNWNNMRTLFAFIRANTAPDDVLLANLDGAFYLNTGRRTVRGFVPNDFDLYYLKRQSPISPDQLSSAIIRERVSWVVLTPDQGRPESDSFHASVEALERGGVLEPVGILGLSAGYEMFRVDRSLWSRLQ